MKPTREDLAKELLLLKMRQYSEDTRAAGWLTGLEFDLWEKAHNKDPGSKWSPESQEFFSSLKSLGEIAGGWWVWPDLVDDDGPSPVFISRERWNQVLADHESASTTD